MRPSNTLSRIALAARAAARPPPTITCVARVIVKRHYLTKLGWRSRALAFSAVKLFSFGQCIICATVWQPPTPKCDAISAMNKAFDADSESIARALRVEPQWSGIAPAAQAIGLAPRTLLHAGPPLAGAPCKPILHS